MSALIGVFLACSGHVLIDLPIFMGPVVLLAGWLTVVTRRARKRERLEEIITGGLSTTDGSHQRDGFPQREIGEHLIGVHA